MAEKKKAGRKPTSRKTGSKLPAALKAPDIFNACPTSIFKFKSTKEVGETHDFISQDRAVRAINMGLGIRKPGYNIYVAGYIGTGKTSVIKSFLEKWSKKSALP